MNAILIDSQKNMRWQPVPTPEPTGAEILIDVHAAALNRADLLQREGKYPPPPGWPEWPGLEVAGTVAALGPECSGRWKPGDKVCALLGGGGYAEKVTAHEDLIMPVPAGLTMEQAAALPEVFATSWLNLVHEAALKSGETVFIQAGASGLGIAAIQTAKFLGAKVITSVGSDEKAQSLRRFAPDIIVNRATESLAAVFDKNPVHVALDCVGGDALAECFPKMATGGRWVLVSTLGGEFANISLRPVLKSGLRLIGSTLRSRPLATKARILRELTEKIWPEIEAGKIDPAVCKIFPITEAEAAHGVLQRRENIGKVVLSIC
ncbi:NAD(P)H-quinone oxidoreductase [Geminisphaera colitermitum]|uniref:NAD(P)H-quinone oxidoreductase n=1 Tax=Geminisphaera colitermitum TaxID=1148786 RepID=UPI000158C84E|nr:NAD(P)H-quinone oxidoreductase [Geminisphaera colitermitum]